MSDSTSRHHLLAILAADVAGYSRLMANDDRATVDALDVARSVFRGHIDANDGHVVDMAGDSILAFFETARGAVAAALAVQAQLNDLADSTPRERAMRFRIGIHLGDVIHKSDGTVYGDGVNIAARLESIAAVGGIAVSEAVKGAVRGRIDASYDDRGEQVMKNIPEPVRVYSVTAATGKETSERRGAGALLPRPEAEPGNLPAVLAPLYGRASELEELSALVDRHRAVTIVGAGGIGKTKLAQAVAHAKTREFHDGVWMTELAALTDGELIPVAVSQALGIKLLGKKSAHEEVLDALLGRALLLVLDNCEHLIGAACAFVAAILQRTQQVRLIATSQEALRFSEEHVYRARPLAVPSSTVLREAQGAGAVAMLAARVQALQPTFTVDERSIQDVVKICRRLDGLPLAIELAAARIPLLGVSGVCDRLDQRFRILTGGARTALKRHQTLRETLVWSHGLLTSDEQCTFRRLSVFSGGLSIGLAQATLSDDCIDEWSVLEQVSALVDKSMLMVEGVQPPRYYFLESVRAFAMEKLADAGELESIRARHCRTMAQWFDHGRTEGWLKTRDALLERYLPDLDNLRTALDFAERGDANLHLELLGKSGWIWLSADLNFEGKQRAEAALSRVVPTTPAALEASVQLTFARTGARTQPGPPVLCASIRAAHLYRELDDAAGLFKSLEMLARAAAISGDSPRAKEAIDEMAQLLRPTWPLAARWDWLRVRAFVLYMGKASAIDEVRAIVIEMKQLAEALGDEDRIAHSLMWLQLNASERGAFAQAAQIGREVISRARNDRFGSSDLSNALGNQALALTQAGELAEALMTCREAAALGSRSGRIWNMLDTFALLACKRERFDAAAIALGRADAANKDINGGFREPVEQHARDEAFQRLSDALPSGRLASLLEQGLLLTDQEAARIALGE